MTNVTEKYLIKILESSEFKGASKYQKLLEYLVYSSLNGIIPKEVTIAYEVYKIEYEHAATGESNVRVYVFNLRKKLDLYYANEGKDDKIRFVISKGAYKVEFVDQTKNKRLYSARYQLIISVLVLLSLGNIFFVINYFGNKNELAGVSKYIWKDFVSNDLPILVVIGDYYLVKDNSFQDRIRFLRDTRINSDPDYELFINENIQYKDIFYKSKLTVLGKFAPLCINELDKFFLRNNKSFDIILSSDFQWQNIQNYNIIYIGSFKSLGIMKDLLKNSNFEFNSYPNELKYHQLKPDSLFHYFSFDSDVYNAYESDYSIVTKIPGTSNTNILLFLSTRDIGLIAMLKYFTNPETIKQFENTYLKSGTNSSYFESCFKTLGLHRNIRTVDLLHINQIENYPLTEIKH